MKITIEGASEEFAEKVLALAAQQGAELSVATVQTGWTVDRAERYLRSLPAGARRFAEMVIVDGDGYLDADHLRSVIGRLNGPTVALSRAVPRGVKAGWWPEGTPAPITPVSNPDNPSWHQNIAYRMDKDDVLPVFREALVRLATPHKGTEPEAGAAWAGDAPSALAPAPGWGSTDDVPRVTFDANRDR
ncbi:hypothetical protein [Streptomyces sp. NPDC057382]|uniref:hypothetical protein n=1 Tax=unclassified Streptomyces TaxID=2593676 RepID=UPI00363F4958